MNEISAHQVLTILSWFLVTILIVFVLMVARLYQMVSGKRTYFWAFAVPIVLLGISSARYAFTDQLAGDALADAVSALGGIVLLGLCTFLYTWMIRTSGTEEG